MIKRDQNHFLKAKMLHAAQKIKVQTTLIHVPRPKFRKVKHPVKKAYQIQVGTL